MQRGKGVIRDLGPRVGGRGQEGRFARIGQAEQSDIGNQLQPQPDRALNPRLARIGAARGLVGGGLEVQVAEAAIAAARQQVGFAQLGQVGDDGVLVFLEDLGPYRHAQHDIGAILAGALVAHAGLAVPGEEMLLVAKVDQRVQPVHHLDDDVAATPAIAAIGAAIFDEFLAPEGDAAAAPRAGADMDFGKVEEFHGAYAFGSGRVEAIEAIARRLKPRAAPLPARRSPAPAANRRRGNRAPSKTPPKRSRHPAWGFGLRRTCADRSRSALSHRAQHRMPRHRRDSRSAHWSARGPNRDCPGRRWRTSCHWPADWTGPSP